MDEKDVYTGKTVEEAVALGLATLDITEEQAEIKVLEEGKKKLIGGIKARVRVTKKVSDGQRAVNFIDGLLDILGLNAVSELVSDGDKVVINLTSMESSRVIGRHGEVLDSIQTLAGAVANIGRDEYKKVVVDCENYREGREQTLIALANRLAKKAVDKQRRVTLEPMNPYERKIIHSALSENTEVRTESSGKEPNRFVVIIPNNERQGGDRRGERRFEGRGREERGKGSFRRDRKPQTPRGGSSSRKKEIHFGTFLGNSGNTGGED